jgi:hypothetical protein
VLSGAPEPAPLTAGQAITVGPEVERRHVFVVRAVAFGREAAGRAVTHGRRWLVPVAGVLGAGLAHPERIDPEVIAPELIVAGIIVLEAARAVAIGTVLEITVVRPIVPVPRGRRSRRAQRGLRSLRGLRVWRG